MGLGNQATYILIDSKTALGDCRIIVPTVAELAECKTAKGVANIPVPDKNDLVGFEGSTVFIPSPLLRNAILASDTNEPFELIPILIVTAAARAFNLEHEEDETMVSKAITHADNLNAWLNGVKAGSINKTRYQINPDDSEITSFCKEHHTQCIKEVSGSLVSFDNSSVISQLTNAISA